MDPLTSPKSRSVCRVMAWFALAAAVFAMAASRRCRPWK
jgi:hypothetical protein